MNFEQFRESLAMAQPPPGLSEYLNSLWFDGKGDWHAAHTVIQDVDDMKAAWIHAYLHHKEGDTFNADYWYRRAGKSRPMVTLNEEWESLVRAMLAG